MQKCLAVFGETASCFGQTASQSFGATASRTAAMLSCVRVCVCVPVYVCVFV